MSSRDEMVERIARATHQAGIESGAEYCDWDRLPVSVILGYRHDAQVALDAILPEVDTVKELASLPFGTAVAAGHQVWQYSDDSHFHWQGLDTSWHSADLIANYAPLTVVWQP